MKIKKNHVGSTDESSPAATLFTPATDGRQFLGKAITNIVEAEDGTISFDFMKDIETGIVNIDHSPFNIDHSAAWYTLDGHKVANGQSSMINGQSSMVNGQWSIKEGLVSPPLCLRHLPQSPRPLNSVRTESTCCRSLRNG